MGINPYVPEPRQEPTDIRVMYAAARRRRTLYDAIWAFAIFVVLTGLALWLLLGRLPL